MWFRVSLFLWLRHPDNFISSIQQGYKSFFKIFPFGKHEIIATPWDIRISFFLNIQLTAMDTNVFKSFQKKP